MQPLLGAAVLNSPTPEQRRRHAIEGGCLVAAHEGIRVQPVTACTVPAVDDSYPHVGVVHQGVDEGHPARTRANYQVIGRDHLAHTFMVDLSHHPVKASLLRAWVASHASEQERTMVRTQSVAGTSVRICTWVRQVASPMDRQEFFMGEGVSSSEMSMRPVVRPTPDQPHQQRSHAQ